MKKLIYPYSYGDELTPELARSTRNKIKMLIILFWLLNVSEGQAAPLPGADGFTPTYLCRKRQTYSYSRESSDLNTRLQESSNNKNRPRKNKIYQYITEFDCTIDNKQIQKKYKYAKDFGILGNFSQNNAQLFKDKIIRHMKEPSTQIIESRFKKIEVTHYFNPETGLNVFFNRETKKFISGWLLNKAQLKNIQNQGALLYK